MVSSLKPIINRLFKEEFMATIGTDPTALNAAFYSNLAVSKLQKNQQRLASGKRLASDDAAGYAVSTKLDAAVRRLNAASQGAQTAISFNQTSSGYLSTIGNELSRLSELALRATNGAINSSDRQDYNTEYTQLRDLIIQQTGNATFNGTQLFDTNQNVSTTVDENGNTFRLNIADASGDVSGIVGSDISTAANATTALSNLNTAIQNISTSSAKVNGDISVLTGVIGNINTNSLNIASASSRIQDVDFAKESVDNAANSILNQASIALLVQANHRPKSVLKLLGA
jgi:flagellin